MSAKERKITAYHEGGHALVAAALNHTDPVTKVTILPRGRALGYTMVMPMDDKYSTTRNEILDQLAYALGGRVAEEIVFHDPTTGAANDIEKATGMARKMVTEFGMSERIGAIKLGQSQGEVFLGRDMGHQRDYSEEIAGVVDEEVRKLIENAHDEAWHVDQRQPRRPRPARPRAAREARPSASRAGRDLRRRRQAAVAAALALRESRAAAATARRCSRPAERAAPNGTQRSDGHLPPPTRAPTPPSRRRSTRRPRPARTRSPRSSRRAGHRGSGRPAASTPTRDSDPWRSTSARAEAAVRELLLAVGEDPDREGSSTPPAGWPAPTRRPSPGLDKTPSDVLTHDVRDRPRRDDHRARHRGLLHLRAPPRPVPRRRPRRVHPRPGRPRHRPVQDRPPRRPVRASPAGPGAPHHPDRRRARGAPGRAGRHRRRRVRAPVHVDARRPQARLPHHHLGRPRPAAQPRHPSRGDVAAARGGDDRGVAAQSATQP